MIYAPWMYFLDMIASASTGDKKRKLQPPIHPSENRAAAAQDSDLSQQYKGRGGGEVEYDLQKSTPG